MECQIQEKEKGAKQKMDPNEFAGFYRKLVAFIKPGPVVVPRVKTACFLNLVRS
jgi:hypothetical protein